MPPGIQNVSVNSSYDTAKSRSDMQKLFFRDVLHTTGFYDREPKKKRISGVDKCFKNDLDNAVRKSLCLDTNFKGKELKKILFHPT